MVVLSINPCVGVVFCILPSFRSISDFYVMGVSLEVAVLGA